MYPENVSISADHFDVLMRGCINVDPPESRTGTGRDDQTGIGWQLGGIFDFNAFAIVER